MIRLIRTFMLTKSMPSQTYTVEFKRDGSPLRGHIVGRLKSNGHRFIANHGDEQTLQDLCSSETEQVGKSGKVTSSENGTNLFTFRTEAAKL